MVESSFKNFEKTIDIINEQLEEEMKKGNFYRRGYRNIKNP